MIPEITIKISFAPAPGGGIEPTVAALDIAPPELPGESSVADIPPPPEGDNDSLSSFTYEVPPPPVVMTVEHDIPAIPATEGSATASEETNEPPPPSSPKGGRRRPERL
ncbi:MAG: hypothetical protein ACFCVA_01250 [Gammaproteobacteria bacterium]